MRGCGTLAQRRAARPILENREGNAAFVSYAHCARAYVPAPALAPRSACLLCACARDCLCVCVCVRARAHACACVCVCAEHACMRACVQTCVHACKPACMRARALSCALLHERECDHACMRVRACARALCELRRRSREIIAALLFCFCGRGADGIAHRAEGERDTRGGEPVPARTHM